MPQNCFFKIDGMDGSVKEKNFEKFTVAYYVDIESFFDFNPNSASKAGDMKWKPIKVITRLEGTAPEWLMKYRKGTEVKAEIRFPVKDAKDGATKAYFVVKMEQVQIISWRIYCPETWIPENREIGHLCEISLATRKFTVEHDKYAEAANEHRKTQDTYNFDDPTG